VDILATTRLQVASDNSGKTQLSNTHKGVRIGGRSRPWQPEDIVRWVAKVLVQWWWHNKKKEICCRLHVCLHIIKTLRAGSPSQPLKYIYKIKNKKI